MLTQSQYTALIEKAISSLAFDPRFSGLYDPVVYTLSAGGKRLRPTLLMAAAQAYGTDPASCVEQALGIEMFHNFTLLHDDVMDNADVRRGRPTVHRRWNTNTAILSGDAMLTLAGMLMGTAADSALRRVMAVVNETALGVYEGQQLDMEFEDRSDVSVEEYIEMIRLKTSVLLGGACKIGAILGGASDEDCDAFYDYAMNLGIAFQLQDDMLDTFGDPAVFGKAVGGDIANSKKTWLLITAMKEDTTGTIAQAVEGRIPEAEKFARVKAVYEQLGLPERIAALIGEYTEKALASLASTSIGADARQFFESLTRGLATRRS